MSYLETRITRTEFILTRGAPQTQDTAKTTLSVFDYFCKAEHRKDVDKLVNTSIMKLKIFSEFTISSFLYI